MNELEELILKEKLKDHPNYRYIRRLQQLSLKVLKEIKNNNKNNLFLRK
tara:strand:- start:15578 stop:15724 length:147 start_codon:yes stop_codon:yes gene_type:complete